MVEDHFAGRLDVSQYPYVRDGPPGSSADAVGGAVVHPIPSRQRTSSTRSGNSASPAREDMPFPDPVPSAPHPNPKATTREAATLLPISSTKARATARLHTKRATRAIMAGTATDMVEAVISNSRHPHRRFSPRHRLSTSARTIGALVGVWLRLCL
ncbi:hypothetical protein A4X06_0g7840 [Tilletia controversa]|uniref:Uncharacterized protein n=1 Tax=Tilletia controversa TaxID=13291 RepID=A0A8X7MM50_9BASI|nr:hypothetical protein A4X06_0g7840 [Tilletia controversa]